MRRLLLPAIVPLLVLGAVACAGGRPAYEDVPVTVPIEVDTARVYPADSVTVAPSVASHEELTRLLSQRYPRELTSQGVGGSAEASFIVDAGGNAHDVRVTRSSGVPALDRATVEVIRRLPFHPGRMGTDTVVVSTRMTLTWRAPG